MEASRLNEERSISAPITCYSKPCLIVLFQSNLGFYQNAPMYGKFHDGN